MRCVLGLAVLLLGCAPGNSCNGAAPDIADCTARLAWADCGGTGSEPRFACDGGDCRWFANGCVAAGFEASSCPANDLCCRDNAPFEAGPLGAERDVGVSRLTLGWGTTPWDAVRDRNVGVVVGATASATRPSIDCVDVSGMFRSVCGSTSSPLRASWGPSSGDVVAVQVASALLAGQALTVEILPGDAGALGARVCVVPFGDAVSAMCSTETIPRGCATSGNIVADAMPPTRIDVDATFADGSTISLRL